MSNVFRGLLLPVIRYEVCQRPLALCYILWKKAFYNSLQIFNVHTKPYITKSPRYQLSNDHTCFLSLDVRSRYLGSNTILCSSFSQVENADTCKNTKVIKNYSMFSDLRTDRLNKEQPLSEYYKSMVHLCTI